MASRLDVAHCNPRPGYFISFLFCIDCKPLGQRWLSTEHRTASGCYFCPLDVDLRSTAARYFEAKP